MRMFARLCFIAASAILLYPASAHSGQLSVSLTVDFGKDRGQNLGTLFEVKSDTGDTLCAAGFATYTQTRAVAANRWLEFYCKSDAPLKVEDLGRIAPDVWRPKLISLPDRVIETSVGYTSEDGEHWTKDNKFSGIFSGQMVENRPLFFRTIGTSTVVQYDGNEIVNVPKNARAGIYYRGRLALALIDNTVMLCDWSPGTKECLNSHVIPHESVSDIYAAIGYDDKILLIGGPADPLNNRGHQILKIERDNVSKIYESDHIYGQIYTALVWKDRILTGEFPDGYVYSMLPETGSVSELSQPPAPGVRLHFPAALYPSSTDYWLDHYREAQSMALYGGRVIVGMYPWAQLFSSTSLRSWNVVRLASEPIQDDTIGWPYRHELETRLSELIASGKLEKGTPRAMPSFWAQRVTSIVPSRGGLLASVGNRSGGAAEPDGRDTVMPKSSIDQYGRVYRISVPNSTLLPFDWPTHPIDMKFEVTDTGMSITVDGVSQQVRSASLPADMSTSKIVVGKGIFGPSTADITKH